MALVGGACVLEETKGKNELLLSAENERHQYRLISGSGITYYAKRE